VAHAEQEGKIQYVFETIQQLIEARAAEPGKRRYGFPTNQAVVRTRVNLCPARFATDHRCGFRYNEEFGNGVYVAFPVELWNC
jgi:hypothetical protein